MKFKKIVTSVYLTGFFLLCYSKLFYSPTLIANAPEFLPEPDFSLSDNCSKVPYNNEIIVLLNESITYQDGIMLLSNLPSAADIVEHQEDYLLIRIEKNAAPAVLDSLLQNPLVLTAEYNQLMNVKRFSDGTLSNPQWTLQNLNIPEAWSIYQTLDIKPKEVIVAILDTGVDALHPDLADHMWMNKKEISGDKIDNDGNGYADDIHGWDFYNDDATISHYFTDEKGKRHVDLMDNDNHGTHCAGIIAAAANDSMGTAGIASNVNVKIMSLKIHGGKEGKGTIANAVKAIKYASAMGADICNMSWGSSVYSAALELVMKESPMLFVTAAGNDGINIDQTPLYPASFSLNNIISVTFTDEKSRLTADSNYGKKSVDIAAPGTNVISTVVGGYDSLSGSSMAAPHIAGIAALLYSTGDNLYASNVKEVLTAYLTSYPKLKGYVANPGIPDAALILKHINRLQSDTTAPTISFHTSYVKEDIILEIETDDSNGSGVQLIKYAPGIKKITDFKGGSAGTAIRSDTLSLSKAGEYTFYISDYAGNQTIAYYTVYDDTTPPKTEASYILAPNTYIYTITAKISDSESGVKLVKYSKGIKNIADFKADSQGTVLKSTDDLTYSFSADSAGKYTIYTTDYRGNKSVSVIELKPPVSSFYLNRTGLFMFPGSQFRIFPLFEPNGSTDTLTFQSTHPSVAAVNRFGIITGISPGFTTITVTTSHGLSAKCLVFVTPYTKLFSR